MHIEKRLISAFAALIVCLVFFLTPINQNLGVQTISANHQCDLVSGAGDCSEDHGVAVGTATVSEEMGVVEYFTSGAFLISITGVLLAFSGWILNSSIEYFIVDMGKYLGDTNTGMGKAIVESWIIIRDLINLTFVFGLIYLAFMTIAKADTHKLKHGVVNIIIGALLINFSIFFGKAIIDVANVTAIEIYEQMSIVQGPGEQKMDVGISGFFAQKLGIVDTIDPVGLITTPNGSVGGDLGTKAGKFGFGFSIFVSLIFLVTSFVFIAGGILIAIRFIVLALLLILSPVAFAFAFIPKVNTEEWSHMWWEKMVSQALFAPAYLLLLYIAMNITNGATLKGGTSVIEFFSGEGEKSIGALLNFVLIIGLLAGSLIVAKKMGAYGASATNSMLLRHSAGRISRGALNFADRLSGGEGRMSRAFSFLMHTSGARGALIAGRDSKYGGAHSLTSVEHDWHEHKKAVGDAAQKRTLTRAIAAFKKAPTSANRIAMERELAGASTKELEALGHSALHNESVIQALSHKQFEDLLKSDHLSGAERVHLEEMRGKQVEATLTTDEKDPAKKKALAEVVGKATVQQLKALGVKRLMESDDSDAVLAAMNSDQMKDLKKELTETEYGTLKTRRNAALIKSFKGDTKKFFEERTEKEISQMPTEILHDKRAAEHLTAEALKKIVDNGDLKAEERKPIKVNMVAHVQTQLDAHMRDSATVAHIDSETQKKFVQHVKSELDKRRSEVENTINARAMTTNEFKIEIKDSSGNVTGYGNIDTAKLDAARAAGIAKLKTEIENGINKADLHKEVAHETENNWKTGNATHGYFASPQGKRF